MLVLPAIDLVDGRCVRLTRGDYAAQTVYSDAPVEVARDLVARGAEMLHIVDLDGARQGRPVNHEVVLEIAKAVKVPIQVGGGVRTTDSAEHYLDGGVDTVILGTAAIEKPTLLAELISTYDSQSLTVSLDVRGRALAVRGWRERSDAALDEVVNKLKRHGLKRIIVTDIDHDGTLGGTDFKVAGELVASGLQTIAAGGITTPNDVRRFKEMGGHGVVIGKALYEGVVQLEDLLEAAK